MLSVFRPQPGHTCPSLARTSLRHRTCSTPTRQTCRGFFKNFKNPLRQSGDQAGTYGSQKRDDYSSDDVEQYFNYMGMLAAELQSAPAESLRGVIGGPANLLMLGPAAAGTPAVDLLLLMAASENDAPKIAELLRAGADVAAKDPNGKDAKQLATAEDAQSLLKDPQSAHSF